MRDHVLVSGQNVTPPRSRAGAGLRVPRVIGVCLLVLAAIGYSGWVLEFFLSTGLPAGQAYIAELSADGRPYHQLFRAIDFVTGALALAATPLLARLVPAQVMPRLTVVVIALFGVIMLLRGALTLDCAPSVSEVCASGQAGGALSSEHKARWALAVANSVIFLLGAASAERWFSRGFWRNGLRLAVGLAVVTGAAILALGALGPGAYVGLVVRVQTGIHAAALFFGAMYLVYTARRPQRE